MTKEGDKFTCETCGIETTVTKACDEETCDMICCGNQMKTPSPVPE